MVDKEQFFEQVVAETLEDVANTLIKKAKEYRREKNPFHNFEKGSIKSGIIREKVLDGFLLKHLISVDDLTNDLESGIIPSKEMIEEKFNDIICYYIIKKAMFLEHEKINLNN